MMPGGQLAILLGSGRPRSLLSGPSRERRLIVATFLMLPWLLSILSSSDARCLTHGDKVSIVHFVREPGYKGLPCPVRPTCEVSWLKDGLPITETSLEVNYRCDGRVIYFKKTTQEYGGNYTCLARENCAADEKLPFSIDLRVTERNHGVEPVNMQYSDCEDQVASLGDNVTFCCLFYTGRSGDDVYSWWELKHSDNDSIAGIALNATIPRGRHSEYNDELEEMACTTVAKVTEESFGFYFVTISNYIGRPQRVKLQLQRETVQCSSPSWYLPTIYGLVAVASVTVVAAILFWRKRVPIQLAWRDRFAIKERGDGKVYDAYISYSWPDVEGASSRDEEYAVDLSRRLGALGYSVCLGERDFLYGSVISEEISRSLVASRRYIILLSPEFLTSSYMSHETEQCLDVVKSNRKHIIPVFLSDVPDEALLSHTVLHHIVTTHPRLDWRIFDVDGSKGGGGGGGGGGTSSLKEMVSLNGTTPTPRKLNPSEQRVWNVIRLRMPPTRYRSEKL